MNDKDYNSFLKQSINLKNIREERKKEITKDELFRSCKKKVQTTMIGALSTLEEQFGFLWGFDILEEERTPEQKKIHEIYEEARAKILDRGNTQIRNLETEFVNYDITRKKHYITLPMAQDKGDKDGRQE